jgi:CheY-like chemotaxis protein/signal transduction histidine kinase
MSASPLPTRETFGEWVHDALNHLYDSPHLQAHPLAERLAGHAADALPRSQHLRRVLLEAIQSMRPETGIPAQSSDWRAYRLLELRYLEGLASAEVMNQLALGKSQYYRERSRVLEAMTDKLWERFRDPRAPSADAPAAEAEPSAAPAEAAGSDAPDPAAEAAPPADPAEGATREDLAWSEAQRLYNRATWEVVDVAQLLLELRSVIEPLARVKAVEVEFQTPTPPGAVRADRVMLRQAILNVITYALDLAPAGRVVVATGAAQAEAGLAVSARGAAVGTPRRPGVGLEIGRQLLSELGGALHVTAPSAAEPETWAARLTWPLSRPQTLLVIDDNQGFVDLFRRYLAASDWHVLGAADGAAARALIAETRPAVIILDVMMPREDGWEFLMALKADPATRELPVIICSVLTEPQLAATLGAAAYLPKPVTPAALRQALAPWGAVRGGASAGPAR